MLSIHLSFHKILPEEIYSVLCLCRLVQNKRFSAPLGNKRVDLVGNILNSLCLFI